MSQPLATFQSLNLDPEFPCSLYRTSSTLFRDVIFCHWHEAVEFILVTRGKLLLTIHMETLVLRAGDVAMVNPGEIHFGNPADGEYCEARALVFDAGFLDGHSGDLCQKHYIDPLKAGSRLLPHLLRQDDYPDMTELIQGLVVLMENRLPARELLVKARLYEILAMLYARDLMLCAPRGGSADPALLRLKKALGYLSSNYTRKIYIADAAAEVAMSEDYFYRFFKKHTRMSPVEYLTRYRMQEAKKLLQSTDLPVTQVCYAVGFEQVSHFIRTFSHHAGCTPKIFRDRHLAAQDKSFPVGPG